MSSACSKWYTSLTMLIALDARMILPQMTGIGRYLLGLATGFCQLGEYHTALDLKLEMWLQAALPDYHSVWSLSSKTLHLHRLKIRHMDIRQHWAIPAELRRLRPDLLHYPHFDLPPAVTTPTVVTIHDLKYLSHAHFFPRMSFLKRLAVRLMMTYSVHQARQVITVSDYTRQDLAERLRIPLAKLHTIPHGVDERYNQSIPPETILSLRQRYQLADNYILFVGERRPHKNISSLLHAFTCLQKICPKPYQLVIAGKTYADYKEPERLAESLGLGDSIRFLDYIAEADLPALYRGAAAFTLLSYYEGFGLPVLEAMACGTPVLVANRTALPEVCGQAGLLVEPDQPEAIALALGKILPGGEFREQAIAFGLDRAAQFTWRTCAEKTLEVYRHSLLDYPSSLSTC